MEFWEAWVEQRTQSAPTAAAPTVAEARSDNAAEGDIAAGENRIVAGENGIVAGENGIVAGENGIVAGENGTEGGEGELRAPAPVEPGTARLYLNLGRRDGVRIDDVVQLLAERVGLAEAPKVQVRNTHTYITVRVEDASRVMALLNGGAWGDRALLCEAARGY